MRGLAALDELASREKRYLNMLRVALLMSRRSARSAQTFRGHRRVACFRGKKAAPVS